MANADILAFRRQLKRDALRAFLRALATLAITLLPAVGLICVDGLRCGAFSSGPDDPAGAAYGACIRGTFLIATFGGLPAGLLLGASAYVILDVWLRPRVES
jgi:hypothetical protein